MQDRRLLYRQFQEIFPIESLKDMTLDEYTNLDKASSFCYWLESKTSVLGSIWGALHTNLEYSDTVQNFV